VHELRIQVLHREEHGSAGPIRLPNNCTRHAIARREIASRILALHEPFPRAVDETRTFPSQRFGQQKAWMSRHVERCRVELDELEIGDACAGEKRHRHTVAGGDGRIGSLAEHLSGAAGRKEHRGRTRRSHRSIILEKPGTHAAAVFNHKANDADVGVSGHAGQRRDALPEHPSDLTPRRVARVQHAPRAVGPFDRERRLPIGIAVEPCAPRDQLADVGRTVFREGRDGALVAEAIPGGDRIRGV
jgi:hypothetical protein